MNEQIANLAIIEVLETKVAPSASLPVGVDDM